MHICEQQRTMNLETKVYPIWSALSRIIYNSIMSLTSSQSVRSVITVPKRVLVTVVTQECIPMFAL